MQRSESCIPASVRDWLETNYYNKVSEQARLDHAAHDPEFWRRPESHVALFSDHGAVHARDVASQVVAVLDTINGVLIARRPEPRLHFMRGFGVLLAWLHDIGMRDFSPFGRAMHPEFAAQTVFSPAFDAQIEALWHDDRSSVAARLRAIDKPGALHGSPQVVLRELLALSMGHSKSKLPAGVLANRATLREVLQTTICTDLHALHAQQRGGVISRTDTPAGESMRNAQRFYRDVAAESFLWLMSDAHAVRELAEDAIDTVRALRAADALRQRGTVLKTSAGYEIFVSQHTANAMYALRHGDQQLLLYEVASPLAAGEANIASCELDRNGDLRISFHHGAFTAAGAVERAAEYATLTINDIQADVISSFLHPTGEPAKQATGMRILIEAADDNPYFAQRVKAQFAHINPMLEDRLRIVPSLRLASELERNRYLQAGEIDWDERRRATLLDRLVQSGFKRGAYDLANGFEHARLAKVDAGEMLIEAGAPSAFVYLPLGDGLQVRPLGGYAPFAVRAWMPLGITGVIRGAVRNAQVVATSTVEVLIIPAQVYWQHWHNPYSTEELQRVMNAMNADNL